MALSPLTEVLGTKRAAHLLRRTCLGASVSQIREYAALTPQEAVERLFDQELPAMPPPVDPSTGQEWVISGITDANSDDGMLMGYFLDWKIGQMLSADIAEEQTLAYAFRERLVFFLHTHFTSKRSKVGSSRSLYFQDELFRQYAFDQNDRQVLSDEGEEPEVVPLNFRELVKKVTLDNAMLRFLDGRLNVRGNPNENYAREFFELYTIGRGLESNNNETPEFEGDYIYYTEQDVQQAALVLSGFDEDRTFENLDLQTGLPSGIVKGGDFANQHDNNTKLFSERFGGRQVVPDPNLLLNGQATSESALDEIDQLVNMVFDQEETARHIMRKLYRFFVYHEITDDLHGTVIQDMANTFSAEGFKIYPVLVNLLTSQHFYDAEEGVADNNFGGVVKSPLDLVIGFARTFELALPSSSLDLEGFYEVTERYRRDIRLMGLDLYEPFEVAGYPGYHQFPLYYRSWITTNYLTNRYNFMRQRIAIAANAEMGQLNTILWFLNNFPVTTLRDARSLIVELIQYVHPVSMGLSFDVADGAGEITPERLNFYLQEFLFREGLGDTGEVAWDAIWDTSYDADIVSERLAFLLNAILQTPEYQLM